MRKVVLATPAYGHQVDAYYHHSVVATVKLCARNDIDVVPLTWPGEALIQHARNQLTRLALDVPQASDIFWIDADQEWQPEWFLRLLQHPVAVVGAAYPKKGDKEEYTVRVHNGTIQVDRSLGLWQVDSLGTGFLRIRRDALQKVWDSSEPYEAWNDSSRMLFDVQLLDGRLWSEDTIFCAKLIDAGYRIYLDPAFTVGHNGYKRYSGDFYSYVVAQAKRNGEESLGEVPASTG